ncbi:hypothetical protein ABFV62_27880, partial [Pseudomonas syringae]|uniref:hypothetical protein n=1 Tax=Pseudomonas syringae TaxID=317 RepID=UPI0034D394D8
LFVFVLFFFFSMLFLFFLFYLFYRLVVADVFIIIGVDLFFLVGGLCVFGGGFGVFLFIFCGWGAFLFLPCFRIGLFLLVFLLRGIFV